MVIFETENCGKKQSKFYTKLKFYYAKWVFINSKKVRFWRGI